ncbi:hypothetical protein SDC9_165860 [bioreactor metagenome]|uniref:Uncharacterized protein n=1 Tax=bioreactor metagenome TaxID=1076179 RepID=A0A645FXY0_9ZZZZ
MPFAELGYGTVPISILGPVVSCIGVEFAVAVKKFRPVHQVWIVAKTGYQCGTGQCISVGLAVSV